MEENNKYEITISSNDGKSESRCLEILLKKPPKSGWASHAHIMGKLKSEARVRLVNRKLAIANDLGHSFGSFKLNVIESMHILTEDGKVYFEDKQQQIDEINDALSLQNINIIFDTGHHLLTLSTSKTYFTDIKVDEEELRFTHTPIAYFIKDTIRKFVNKVTDYLTFTYISILISVSKSVREEYEECSQEGNPFDMHVFYKKYGGLKFSNRILFGSFTVTPKAKRMQKHFEQYPDDDIEDFEELDQKTWN